jgi:large subunit ribosomal protein L19
MDPLKQLELETMRLDHPEFTTGDTIKVYVKIREGEKERTQAFEGVVIGRHNGTSNSTFTAKIYYLRKLRGKAARLKERR